MQRIPYMLSCQKYIRQIFHDIDIRYETSKKIFCRFLHVGAVAELSACSKSFPNHGFIENLRVPDCLHVLITLQDNGLLLKRLRIFLQQRLLKKYFHLPDRLQQLRHEKLIFYPRVVPQWTQNLPPFTILTLLTDEISHLPQKNATHDIKSIFCLKTASSECHGN